MTGSTSDNTLYEAQSGQHHARKENSCAVLAVGSGMQKRLPEPFGKQCERLGVRYRSIQCIVAQTRISVKSRKFSWPYRGRKGSNFHLAIVNKKSVKTFKQENTSRHIQTVSEIMATTGPQGNRLVLRLVPGLSLPTNAARLERSLSTQEITSWLV